MGDHFFIKRNKDNQIIAIASQPIDGGDERLPRDHPDVIAFFDQQNANGEEPQQALVESDRDMIRIIEDLIELLIEKQLINFTDLPDMAQEKILKRKKIRHMLREIT